MGSHGENLRPLYEKDRKAYERVCALMYPIVENKQVLELATGTGLIAKHIVRSADHIEATDASAETVERELSGFPAGTGLDSAKKRSFEGQLSADLYGMQKGRKMMKNEKLQFDRTCHVLYSKPCKKQIKTKIAMCMNRDLGGTHNESFCHYH